MSGRRKRFARLYRSIRIIRRRIFGSPDYWRSIWGTPNRRAGTGDWRGVCGVEKFTRIRCGREWLRKWKLLRRFGCRRWPEMPPLEESIIVVTGLPRSGTSMLMQMLAAGGMGVVSDGLRAADEDNPRGYFEFEPVKNLLKDSKWLFEARGRAIKIVVPLLGALPDGSSLPCGLDASVIWKRYWIPRIACGYAGISRWPRHRSAGGG